MADEPAAAIIAIFGQVIDTIKSQALTGSDGTPTGTPVYSQLVMAMACTFKDYGRPWSPFGNNTVQSTFASGAAPPATPQLQTSMEAAFKVSTLGRTMLQVVNDGVYRQYPIGRHLDFAYDIVVNGMQPDVVLPLSPDVLASLTEANKVLYVFEGSEPTLIKTDRYKRYQANQIRLAKAQGDFAVAFQAAQQDPAKFEVFPITSEPLRLAVEQARDDLIAEGGRDVERALAVIGSVGIQVQPRLIDEARERFEAWNLNLSGLVPQKVPYSFVTPSNWCDPEDSEGFTKLIIDQSTIKAVSNTSTASAAASSWHRDASSFSGGGGAILGFMAFGGTHESSSMSQSFEDSSATQFHRAFSNAAKGLHIELEYAMCTIVRPWLTTDLFFVKGWHLVGARKNSISDGTIDGQVQNTDQLLPMIPQQFLVIRNVVIQASDWGSDGEVLERFYGANAVSAEADTSSTKGLTGISLGFITFGGRARSSSSSAGGQSSSFAAQSSAMSFGATFANNELRIDGAQIVAFLSDIVPASPERDDPSSTDSPVATDLAELMRLFQQAVLERFGLGETGAAAGLVFAFGTPLPDAGFRLPDGSKYSPARALEFMSHHANTAPRLVDGIAVPTFNRIDQLYSILLRGASPVTPNAAGLLGAIKRDAEAEFDVLLGSSSPPGLERFRPTHATPIDWYDQTVAGNWTEISVGQAPPAPPPPRPAPSSGSGGLRGGTGGGLGSPFRPKVAPGFMPAEPSLAAVLASPVSLASAETFVEAAGLAPLHVSVGGLRAPAPANGTVLGTASSLAAAAAAANAVPIASGPTPTMAAMTSNDFSLHAQVCFVTLRRSWLSSALLALDDWFVPGIRQGQLAGGDPSDTSAPLSLLPVGCVCVRNLVIRARWTPADRAASQTSSHLGAFALAGRVFDSSEAALRVDGMQSVAWVCQALPELPPNDPPS